jgi:hypothetical protein
MSLFSCAFCVSAAGTARADPERRLSFELEAGTMFGRRIARDPSGAQDIAGIGAFVTRLHYRIGERTTIAPGLGMSPMSAILVLTALAGDPVALPDPIMNLQVPVTFYYVLSGVHREGLYFFGGPRFSIVPVLPCADDAKKCPAGQSKAFAFGPVGEAGIGYQIGDRAKWRVSAAFIGGRLYPLGNSGADTQPSSAFYQGFAIQFGGITEVLH